jgi:hypothetical protein
MTNDSDPLDMVMACLKQMESTVLGLRQLRSFIGKGSGQEMLDALIVEAEEQIA